MGPAKYVASSQVNTHAHDAACAHARLVVSSSTSKTTTVLVNEARPISWAVINTTIPTWWVVKWSFFYDLIKLCLTMFHHIRLCLLGRCVKEKRYPLTWKIASWSSRSLASWTKEPCPGQASTCYGHQLQHVAIRYVTAQDEQDQLQQQVSNGKMMKGLNMLLINVNLVFIRCFGRSNAAFVKRVRSKG